MSNTFRDYWMVHLLWAFCVLISCNSSEPEENSTQNNQSFPLNHCSEQLIIIKDSSDETFSVQSIKLSTTGGLLFLIYAPSNVLFYKPADSSLIKNKWTLPDSIQIQDYETDGTGNVYLIATLSFDKDKTMLLAFDENSDLKWSVNYNGHALLFSEDQSINTLTYHPGSSSYRLSKIDVNTGLTESNFRSLSGYPPFLPFAKNQLYFRKSADQLAGWVAYDLKTQDTLILARSGDSFMIHSGVDSSGNSLGLLIYSNGFMVNCYNDQIGKGWQIQMKSILTGADNEVLVDAGEYGENNTLFKKIIVYKDDSISRILGLRIDKSIDINAYDFVLEKCTSTELTVVGYAANDDKDLVLIYDQEGNLISSTMTKYFSSFDFRLPSYSCWKYIGGCLLVPVETPEGVHLFSFRP